MAGEWGRCSLADLIDVKHGFAFTGEFISDGPSGDVLLTPGNFAIGGGFKADKFKYYGGPVPEDFVLNEGDLLVTMTDLSKQSDTLGLPAFVPPRSDGRRYLHNQRLGKVLMKDVRLLDIRYLHYLLCSTEYRHEILASATGTTVKHTSPERIRRFAFYRPPLSEQRAIAHILGTLDDKIDLNRRMNETLEAMARATFKDWFVDFGPTRAKMEGRTPCLSPEIWALFPDRLDDEGKPEGWEARPVGDFAELKGGKQLEKEQIASSGAVPVFGGAGIMGYTTNHNAAGFVIAVGRVGAYCGQFFSHRGKAWINNNASLISTFEGIPGEWLFQALRHADIEVIKKGAAQPFVSNTDVAGLPIIWPGEKVVSKFSKMLMPLMLKVEGNQSETETLAITRDLLLPKLMSGEIRVQDAEREVAAAL